MYQSKNYIEKPICLLSFDSIGHALLHQEAISFLKSVPKPISIVSIAGPYRTGKSFLLNSIISQKNCFQVSSSTQSCTKGLWIWGKPLTSINQQGKITNILIIDSEGFGSCEEVHDKRIIILSLLLSACFIYNSKGLIDKDSLKDLQYVIKQTKKVRKQFCLDSTTDFHWVLRDFHFQLVNQLGLQISSDQYMQKCLKQFSERSAQDKQTYQLLCNFFRNRNCHTFVTPVTDQSREQEQNPQFLQQLIKFKRILNGVASINMDGATLSQIIQAYVSDMNQSVTKTQAYKQGSQCKLRLKCINKLHKQLEQISAQQNMDSQKRAKLIKLVLHEVEDGYISKMTSEKQINILKQQVQLILSQYQQSSQYYTSKNINGTNNTRLKQRERRLSLNVGAFINKQVRACLPKNKEDLILQNEVSLNNSRMGGNTNSKISKSQLQSLQKLREQLQAKVHRYQLQVESFQRQLKQGQQKIERAQRQRCTQEQQNSELRDKLMEKQKQLALSTIQLRQQIQKMRQEHLQQYSQVQKQKQLLEEKNAYLEEKLVELEMNILQNRNDAISKYKEQILYMEKENREITNKHNMEIQMLKSIYKNKYNIDDNLSVGNSESNMRNDKQMQFKQYSQQVWQLQQTISCLQIEKLQLENKLELQNNTNEQLKKMLQKQVQSLIRKHKQEQQNLNELYTHQLNNKQKLYQELQVRMLQESHQLKDEISNMHRCQEQISTEHNQILAHYELQIKKMEDQYIELANKYQTEENVRIQKQKYIQELVMEAERKRQQLRRLQGDNYEELRTLSDQVANLKLAVQRLSSQKQQLNRNKEEVEKYASKLKQQYEQQKKQRKNMHEIQLQRLENKVVSNQAIVAKYKELQIKYDELHAQFQDSQQKKQSYLLELNNKDNLMEELQNKYCGLQANNKRLQCIIEDLTQSIKCNTQELQALADNKISNTEEKYKQVQQEYNNRLKQVYILQEKYEQLQKQSQNRNRQVHAQFSEKLQAKNSCIEKLNRQIQEFKRKLQHSQNQCIKNRHDLSLLEQRYQFLQQNHENRLQQLQKYREKQRICVNLENERNKSNIASNMEQIKKLQQEKVQLQQHVLMLENNTRETCSALGELHKKHSTEIWQYQSNVRLLSKRLIQLEKENVQLRESWETLNRKFTHLETNKHLLEDNYHADFQLWCAKISNHLSHIQNKNNIDSSRVNEATNNNLSSSKCISNLNLY